MKKTKRLLSALTALTITASAFAGLVIPVSAESVVYVDENFDSYEAGEIIRAGTTAVPDSVKKGDITYSAGSRKDGITNIASIAAAGAGNELVVSADRFSTAGRGIALTFEPEAAIPQISALAAGEVLKLSAKVKATAGFTVVGYGDISGTDLTSTSDYVYVSVLLDNEGGKKYLIVRDAQNNTLNMIESDLGDIKTISGISFCLGAGAYNIDDIKVEATAKEGEIPQEKFYDVTIKTESYAKLVYQIGSDAEVTDYADVDGNLVIKNVKGGSSFTYKASKDGYTFSGGATESTDTVTIDETKTITVPMMTLTKDLGIAADDLIYYENTFGEGSMNLLKSDRLSYKLLKNVELPAVSTMSFTLSVSDKERTQATVMIKNKDATDSTKTDNTDIIGFQSITADDTLVAFTGFTGDNGSAQSGINQYNAVGAYKNSAVIADRATGTFNIEVILSQSGDVITVKCDDKTVNLPKVNDISSLGAIHMGKHEAAAQVTLDDFLVYKPNENFVSVTGDIDFAKIAGKTVTRKYTAAPAVPIAGETFTWTVVGKTTGEAVTGASIDENGVLSVTDEVTQGVLTITATSSASAEKKGSIDVDIHDVANLIPTIEAPKALKVGGTGKIKVTGIVDEYGDDVTEYFTPTYSIDGVDSIDSEVEFDVTGKSGDAVAISVIKDEDGVVKSVSSENVAIDGDTLTVTAEGGASVMLWNSLSEMTPISNEIKTAPSTTVDENTVVAVGAKSGAIKTGKVGTAIIKVKLSESQTDDYEITVGNYEIIKDFDSNDTTVDISELIENNDISGYQVTIADAEGNQLGQHVVAKADVTDNAVALPTDIDGDPAKVEVAPVFSVSENIPTTDHRYTFNIPADTYDFTVTMNGKRADIYVNEQMLVNNMLQYGSEATDVVHDIVVNEGYAKMNTREYEKGASSVTSMVTALSAVKSPSIVTRKTKMYVLGDSLVANYYNGGSKENNLLQTGWGQVLDNYITDDVEVVNLANSGITAAGLLGTAFSQIIESAKEGDYIILESGYNDKTYDTEAIMKNALRAMISATKAKGVEVILVSPNASHHDLKENVQWTTYMEDIADETNTDYIDLSQLSNDFLRATYDADAFCVDGDPTIDGVQVNELSKIWNVSDRLHSTYNAAHKWASVVTTELAKLGYADLINTEFKYEFTDGAGNTITCQATVN